MLIPPILVYLSQVFWPLSTNVVKLAILFLYLKIFPIRSFHLAVWAVIIGHVVQVLFTVSTIRAQRTSLSLSLSLSLSSLHLWPCAIV